MRAETEFSIWIRQRLWKLNQQIEIARYQEDVGAMRRLEETFVSEGMKHIEGINQKFSSYDEDQAFQVLGDAGTFAASCARHNVEMFQEGGEAIKPLGGLINKVSIITGTAPRAIIHHFTTDNKAIEGAFRGFTHSEDEQLFFRIGAVAMMAYEDASLCLRRVHSLGFSNPLCADILKDAAKALSRVEESYRQIAILKPQSFFGGIMPYLMGYKIRSKSVRGFSAGDFGSANEVDLLIGVCGLEDPFYAGICLEKIPYMRRRGQDSLRSVCGLKNLLDLFLELGHTNSNESWFKESGIAFLEVIDANRRIAKRHHDVLIDKYLTKAIPDGADEAKQHLAEMMKFLQRIRDLRAAESDDVAHAKAYKVRELSAMLGN